MDEPVQECVAKGLDQVASRRQHLPRRFQGMHHFLEMRHESECLSVRIRGAAYLSIKPRCSM